MLSLEDAARIGYLYESLRNCTGDEVLCQMFVLYDDLVNQRKETDTKGA